MNIQELKEKLIFNKATRFAYGEYSNFLDRLFNQYEQSNKSEELPKETIDFKKMLWLCKEDIASMCREEIQGMKKEIEVMKVEKDKNNRIWKPIKEALIQYLEDAKKVYDNEENESDRYNAGLCYKYENALQIISNLPTD